MWVLWDVYHGYHGIYCPTCWGIGEFLAQKDEFVEKASLKVTFFLYSLLVFNDFFDKSGGFNAWGCYEIHWHLLLPSQKIV